jgi:hypothetical protein
MSNVCKKKGYSFGNISSIYPTLELIIIVPTDIASINTNGLPSLYDGSIKKSEL